MKRQARTMVWVVLGVLCASAVAEAQAQGAGHAGRRFALGLGAGLVDTGPSNETYLTAGLRIRMGDEAQVGAGVAGYVEPEVGYWERSAPGVSEEDLMVGVNLGGLVMMRSVSYFIGAGLGLHFLEVDRFGVSDDSESIGVNVHFGLDVHLSPTVSLYGLGRVDLVEDRDDQTQAKIVLGARFHF